jgi:hypothetical protein
MAVNRTADYPDYSLGLQGVLRIASPSICTKISDGQSKLGEMLSDPLYFVNAANRKSDL